MSNLAEIYLPVQRIIPFSNVEGIGNRTSIFLQGCNINCLYCHNPETIALTSPTARLYSLADLMAEIKSAMPFIRGITVSGGEPTLFAKELTILFREVRTWGLTCYLDSNGFFAYDTIRDLIEETDRFLFDIKGSGEGLDALCFSKKYRREDAEAEDLLISVPEKAAELSPAAEKKAAERSRVAELMSRPEAQILSGAQSPAILSRNFENLQKLLEAGKVEEVRLVYIKGFYDEKETVRQIAERLQNYPQVLFKLIRVHAKGARGAKEIAAHMPTAKDTEALAAFAKEQGLNNQVVIV